MLLSYAQKKALDGRLRRFKKSLFTIANMDEFRFSFDGGVRNMGGSPEEDFKRIQKIMDGKGFDIETIKTIFAHKDFGKWFLENDMGDQYHWGYIDVYLYFLNKKLKLWEREVGLGGTDDYGNSPQYFKNPEPEEYFYKYRYGVHRSEYGKLFLEQANVTVDEMLQETFKFFASEIISDISWSGLGEHYRDTDSHLEDLYHIEDDEFVFRVGAAKDYMERKGKKVTEDQLIEAFEEIFDRRCQDYHANIPQSSLELNDDFIRLKYNKSDWE